MKLKESFIKLTQTKVKRNGIHQFCAININVKCKRTNKWIISSFPLHASYKQNG